MAIGSRRKQAAESDSTGPALPAPPAGALPVHPTLPAPVASSTTPPPFAVPTVAAASTPPAPVASSKAPSAVPVPERAVAEVAELKAAVGDLQALVASLVERPAPASTDASDGASRIIVAANEAAEAAIADAREEADRVIAEAKVKSFEIIGVARDLADSELEAERHRVAAASEAWNLSRSTIAEHLASLEGSLAAYRADITATAEAIALAVARLDDTSLALDADVHGGGATDGGEAAGDADVPAAVAADGQDGSDGSGDDAGGAAAGDAAEPAGLGDGSGPGDRAEGDDAGAPRAVFGATTPAPPVPAPGDGSKRSMLFGNGVSKATNGTVPDVATARLRAGVFGR